MTDADLVTADEPGRGAMTYEWIGPIGNGLKWMYRPDQVTGV
jgi:hypothetical protein